MPDVTPSSDAHRVRKVAGSRRAVLPPVPGTDATPQPSAGATRASEDTDLAWGDAGGDGGNDARLKRDVPPHWG